MLTDTEAARTKPDPTTVIRLADGEGLHLAILPNGKRYWRWDYAYQGRRKQLAFGRYPTVSLKRAREKKLAAQELLDAGTDPSASRQREKQTNQVDTFSAVAAEWLAREKKTLHLKTWMAKKARLDTYLLPALGFQTMRKIAPLDVLPLLKAIERQSLHDTVHRVRAIASEIFRFAVVTGRADTDPAAFLGEALEPIQVRHHPTLLDPVEVALLLNRIDEATSGSPYIRAALRLAPLVFLRPGELRNARWTEFDLEAAMWRIPAARMKPTAVRIDHLVPLSTQVVAILRDLQAMADPKNPLVFPGLRGPSRSISDATLGTVLRRIGYSQEQQSVHGFRTLASTHLREIGFEGDLVELQLSHKIANPVRAAYDKAARIPERVRMMQAWADHLDEMKAGRLVAFTGNLVAFTPRQAVSGK